MMLQTRTRAALAALILALLAGLAVGLAEARADSPSPAASTSKVTLRIGWTSEPDNLNPFIGWQNSSFEIWAINYDFLFGFGENAGEPTLDLAREFPTKANGGISADGKVWTVKLRTGVKWSDGRPLTADDVAFTYNYIVKNHMLNMAIATVGIVGAEALAPDVVQITCSRPKADMEHIFLPSCPGMSGRRSARRRPRRASRTRHRSSGAVRSSPRSSRRVGTSRWTATRTTGASDRPSTRSSSSTTPTPTR